MSLQTLIDLCLSAAFLVNADWLDLSRRLQDFVGFDKLAPAPTLTSIAELRPNVHAVSGDLCQSLSAESTPDDIEDLIKSQSTISGADDLAALAGLVWKEYGSLCFKSENYAGAKEAWTRAIRCCLAQGAEYPLPSPGGVNSAVVGTKDDLFLFSATCANNIAQCYVKEGSVATVSF